MSVLILKIFAVLVGETVKVLLGVAVGVRVKILGYHGPAGVFSGVCVDVELAVVVGVIVGVGVFVNVAVGVIVGVKIRNKKPPLA